MKIICKKADLVKAVQTVSKAVPMKSSTTILECILLRAEKEKITLTGNNLELGIETMMSGNIEEEGSIAIQAKVFGEIVRKLPECKLRSNGMPVPLLRNCYSIFNGTKYR